MSYASDATRQTQGRLSAPTPGVAPENNPDSGRDFQASPWASCPPPFACLLCHHTQYHTVILTFNDILLSRAARGKSWKMLGGFFGNQRRARALPPGKNTRGRESKKIFETNIFLKIEIWGLTFSRAATCQMDLPTATWPGSLGGPVLAVVQAPGTVDDGSTSTLKTEHISPFKTLPAWGTSQVRGQSPRGRNYHERERERLY